MSHTVREVPTEEALKELKLRNILPAAISERVWEVFDDNGYSAGYLFDEKLAKRFMVVNEYVKDSVRVESTRSHPLFRNDRQQELKRILHSAMGLCTESGEFMDMLKKHIFYGKQLDYQNLDEEVGDILWYCAVYLDVRHKAFGDVMAANVRKLRVRYPESFSQEKALNRNVSNELAALGT